MGKQISQYDALGVMLGISVTEVTEEDEISEEGFGSVIKRVKEWMEYRKVKQKIKDKKTLPQRILTIKETIRGNKDDKWMEKTASITSIKDAYRCIDQLKRFLVEMSKSDAGLKTSKHTKQTMRSVVDALLKKYGIDKFQVKSNTHAGGKTINYTHIDLSTLKRKQTLVAAGFASIDDIDEIKRVSDKLSVKIGASAHDELEKKARWEIIDAIERGQDTGLSEVDSNRIYGAFEVWATEMVKLTMLLEPWNWPRLVVSILDPLDNALGVKHAKGENK